MTKDKSMAREKPKPRAKRGEVVTLNEDELFGDDADFREAYENARFAREAALMIRRMREKAKLTQKELAALLDVEQPQISKLERQVDLPQGPTYATLRRVALACGFTWRSPVVELDN